MNNKILTCVVHWLRVSLTVIILLSFSGCDDYVTVDPPTTQLTSETVFNDKATATAALMDVYAKLRESSVLTGRTNGMSALLALYADEMVFYGDPLHFGAYFYNNSLLGSDGQAASWWSSSYNQIYSVNAIIEGLQQSATIPQEDKDLFTGESLFIRALIHFYLENLYSRIPYITTTDYALNTRPPRLETAQVYQKIIQDLNEAIVLLPEEYLGADRTRANKSAARALLARVYLYAGDFAGASDQASAVLNNTALYGDETIAASFLKDSRATIWQFSPMASGMNAYEGQSLIFTAGPPIFGTLSPSLLGSFEPGDLRRQKWVNEVAGKNGPWHHAHKYKERAATASSLEYSVMLRLSEMYLIRSEARLFQGETIGSLEDLNHIRGIAGLPGLEGLSDAEMLNAILKERQVELFTELGHRFFDLKRHGLLDDELGAVKNGWNNEDANLPIPESELNLNPNLRPQNPGY